MGNKAVGITLALISGLFIGVSFVFKKRGLLDATAKNNAVAGEGYGYLKNWTCKFEIKFSIAVANETTGWLGMTLMIVGEVCNFVAYAFTEALLVTPLGALAVVTAAIGSSIFLKERLSFVGKVGCSLCILGAVVIVLNAPAQPSVSTIQEMKHYGKVAKPTDLMNSQWYSHICCLFTILRSYSSYSSFLSILGWTSLWSN